MTTFTKHIQKHDVSTVHGVFQNYLTWYDPVIYNYWLPTGNPLQPHIFQVELKCLNVYRVVLQMDVSWHLCLLETIIGLQHFGGHGRDDVTE